MRLRVGLASGELHTKVDLELNELDKLWALWNKVGDSRTPSSHTTTKILASAMLVVHEVNVLAVLPWRAYCSDRLCHTIAYIWYSEVLCITETGTLTETGSRGADYRIA